MRWKFLVLLELFNFRLLRQDSNVWQMQLHTRAMCSWWMRSRAVAVL